MTQVTVERPLRERLAWAAENWERGEGKELVEAALLELDERASLIARQTDTIRALRGERDRVSSEAAAYRVSVRDAAIEAYEGHKHHITRANFNDWLEGLGLAKLVVKWKVTPSLHGVDFSPATVEADDSEEAERKVYRLLESHADVTYKTVLRIGFPDRDDVYWTDSNEAEVENDDADEPDWLDEVEFTVEEVED